MVLLNKKDIANGFNDFFLNIGPQLATKINPPTDENMYDYLVNKNNNSMFLYSVD